MITPQDLLAIGFLVILEGLLSFDNALALAAMVKHLPEQQRKRALTYGMAGAFIFRLGALSIVTYLMTAYWVKWVGGAYLVWLAASHFFVKKEPENLIGKEVSAISFWRTILLVELTDIAFSIDSILAAVAVSSKLWVVVIGGVLGIVAMRFAATVFVGLIERYPKLEHSAFILVAIVGAKLILEASQAYAGVHLLDFESMASPAFWCLWGAMACGLMYGFSKEPRDGGVNFG